MNTKAVKVVFRRIRGRIIPLFTKGNAGVKAGAAGGLGVAVSSIFTMKQNNKDYRTVIKKFDKNKVDAKRFIKKSGIENVKLLSSTSDVSKLNVNFLRKIQLKIAVKRIAGRNAAALELGGKFYVISPKKINKSILGHELGHIKDMKKLTPPLYNSIYAQKIFGGTYKLEKRAWNLSPSKSKDGMKAALRTYERDKNNSRVGFATGAGGFLILRKILR